MECKRVCKADQAEDRSSLDIISTLPKTILEAILSLLPTKEAARTSILSREWRHKWTYIPTLDFYLYDVIKRVTNDKQVQRENLELDPSLYVLHQLLLLHKGPINEFTLHMCGSTTHDLIGFDRVALHLSMYHTVKKLTLDGSYAYGWYKLPVSVFSLHRLIDLDLSCFDLDHPPIFNGFGCLRSLVLRYVNISTRTLLHLLSNCPSLKSLYLFTNPDDKDCTIIELFECLPVIEHLTISYVLKWLVIDSVPKELSTSLSHLKYFCFEKMCFLDGYGLAFLLLLIKCSPNLEKFKIEIGYHHLCDEEYAVVWEEYSDVWLEHLNELEINCFNNNDHEREFVKFILARSPNLKKVDIYSIIYQNQKSELEMAKTLLQAPRLSPVIISVDNHY